MLYYPTFDPSASYTHLLNGMKFSTYHNDNSIGGCTGEADNVQHNGGWWHIDCWHLNPNYIATTTIPADKA